MFGAPGGDVQVQAMLQVFLNTFHFGMDIQEAIDLPRLFPLGGKVQVERGIRPDVVAGLQRLGHAIEAVDRPHGGGQAIWIDHDRGVLIGGSEPRKDGCALGY